MPFPGILDTNQLVQLRQDNVAVAQFVLFNPNDIVWQTQPNAQVDGAIPYAEFAWDGTDQGNRSNVQEGMTVFISTSTAFRTTSIFRGRVRLAPDATDFFIDENSTNLETSYYVTVIDDYDIHEKQERRTTLRFIDWDKVFEKLPPVISGLQSTYVDTTGDVTITLVLAPTVTAMAAGATISSYLWDVADGTITVGSSTTQNITTTFPGAVTNEHRWVRLTVTDSNGVSRYFVFEVYSIDLTSTSSVVSRLGTNAVTVTGTHQEGFNVTVKMNEDFDTVLDRTRCTLVSIDDYGGIRSLDFTDGGTTPIAVDDTITGATSTTTANVVAVVLDSGSWAGGDAAGTLWINQQVGDFESENLDVGASSNLATIAADSINPPITQNVSFIGRLNRESDITRGDEIFSQVQEGQITIEGFSTQLGHMHGPGVYLRNNSFPTAWGQIKTMTVGRAVVYMLSWYSTFLNICSFTLPSDIHDFDWPAYSIQPAPLKSWITSVIDDVNAFMIFAASGECEVARHASYAGTGGLDTILELKIDSSGVSDILEYILDLEYVETHSAAIVGAATYNTTLDDSVIYQGRAPSQVFGPGWETAPIDSQIMKSDLTETQAKAEAGSRVASHLAFVNPKARMSVRLPSGYYWLVPSDHQLYAFDMAAADNMGGRVFTSSDKWLCVEVSYVYNAEIGGYEVSATFEEVTAGGNFGVVVTQVIKVGDLDLPPIGAGLALNDLLVNFSETDPDYGLPGAGGDNLGPGNQKDVPAGCDVLNVSMRSGGTVQTANNTQNGETYIIKIEGAGRIEGIASGWRQVFDFTIDDFDFADTINANYSAGVGITSVDIAPSGTDTRTAQPQKGFTATEVTKISYTYNRTMGTDGAASFWDGMRTFLDGVVVNDSLTAIKDSGSGITITKTNVAVIDFFILVLRSSWTDHSGSLLITECIVEGTGTNPFVSSDSGDAFYKDYGDDSVATLYTGLAGMLVNTVKPGNIPLYNPSHVYEFTAAGDGFPLVFQYNDSDYTDNDNVNLVVTVCGPGMALTQL